MLRVGLTGGIAAGKSTVSRRLSELGAMVIDADVLAREVVAPGSDGLAAVAGRFGDDVVTDAGELDRAALGRMVFDDEQARRDLETITHPRIAARTAELIAAAPAEAVVVHDVPLLVEKGMGPAYHLVLVVGADEQERLRRLVQLRGMSPELAGQRIAAQADDPQRRAAADVWLDNNGPHSTVLAELDRLWSDRILPYQVNVVTGTPSHCPEALPVVPPDPTWPDQARRLAARLDRVLGERATAIEHIGPTAVQGHPAKDVIDLQVRVRDLAALEDPVLLDHLRLSGFPALPGAWWDNDHDGPPAARNEKLMLGHADPGRVATVHVRDGRELAADDTGWVPPAVV